MANATNTSSQKPETTLFQRKGQTTTRGAWQRIFHALKRERLDRTRRRLNTAEGESDKKEFVIRCQQCGGLVEKISC